jgi:CRP-like cAMP-binding protein
MTPDTPCSLHENCILALLPADESNRMRRFLQPVQLEFGQVIYEPQLPVEHVYFVDRGMISIVSLLENGDSIEVGTIDYQGVAGLPAVFGDGTMIPFRHFVQMPGTARRMNVNALIAEMQHESVLRKLLLRYQAAFLSQAMQSVACNGLHSVVQRCCKWLLMLQDTLGSDDVPITHDFLAQMLGVRRASVSDVLRPLQEEGLLRTNRGKVTILDRESLAQVSCECYRLIRGEYDRLLRVA